MMKTLVLTTVSNCERGDRCLFFDLEIRAFKIKLPFCIKSVKMKKIKS